jgi:hypothetical protein
MTQMARALHASGFLPNSINTPEKAVAIILAGRELNIGAWQALQTINVIQGKPTVSPQLMLALINSSGQLEDMKVDGDAKGCTVMMKRRGRQPHTETFSYADATALGLTGKDNYKKQPAVMLRWRAVAACARIVFPDVILGLYTPDEMGANVNVTEDGGMEVVNVETGEIVVDSVNGISSGTIGSDAPKAYKIEHDANSPTVRFGEDKARITAFVTRMADAYGVTAPEIVKALGVTRFGEYTGSEDDAEATVKAWVKPEAAAPAEAAKPAAKANGKPAADAKAPDWTPELAQAWANMLKWAADEFDYDEDGVLLLLNDVQPPVLSKKDWRGTTMQARGAVLAGFCEYDVTRIDAWCDKAGATDELRGRAKDMAEAYKLAAVEVR